MDNETEAAIQKALIQITQNRTTIAIAHRLSTIRHADCIYVMDKGEIAECGTHGELLTKNGIYTKLWQVQSGDTEDHPTTFGKVRKLTDHVLRSRAFSGSTSFRLSSTYG